MKCIYVSTVVALVGGLSLSPPSQARVVSIESIQPNTISGMPETLGYPRDGTRRGGGSRGGVCDLPPDVPPLTALMPETATWVEGETAREVVLSFTHSAAPELWFYLPYSLLATSRVEFTLKDAAGESLKRARLDTAATVPPAPSIIHVSLANLGLTLTPTADYHWYLTVGCEGGPPIVVDGWIRYQPEGDAAQRSGNSDRFFVDSLSSLADAQWANPDDSSAQSDWQALLESVGLGDIAQTPLIDCCSFVEQLEN